MVTLLDLLLDQLEGVLVLVLVLGLEVVLFFPELGRIPRIKLISKKCLMNRSVYFTSK